MQISFVMKENFIAVNVGGKPVLLDGTHPTFSAMSRTLALYKKAVDADNVKMAKTYANRIPKLVSVAETVKYQTAGAVTLNKDGVLYKGSKIDSSLTKRIIQLLKEGKNVRPMLLFMDNLYKNPDQRAINELYDFLQRCELPITDDGCFMAYKSVRSDYKDCHSGTMDNSVGAVPMMPRKKVDPDRTRTCSDGLHFCSRSYVSGFLPSGGHLMGVKVNPKDVVSIPNDYDYAKGRAWRYEVVLELADAAAVVAGQDSSVYQTSVLPVEKDRQKLLDKILAHPTIVRAIKHRKLKARNIRKGTLGRLTKLYASLPLLKKETPVVSSLFDNPIKVSMRQNRLTLKEVAEELDVTPKEVYDALRFVNVKQETIDRYLAAINELVARKLQQAVAA
jgi:hypothetical protein